MAARPKLLHHLGVLLGQIVINDGILLRKGHIFELLIRKSVQICHNLTVTSRRRTFQLTLSPSLVLILAED